MITTFLLQIAYNFLSFLLGLLPTGGLPSQIAAAFSYFMGVVNTFSYVIPIATLLQAAVVIAVFDGALLLWAFINWIIRKIPGMQ